MKSNYRNWHEICSLATKQENKYSVYISNGFEYTDDDCVIWDFVKCEILRLYKDNSLDYLSNLVSGGLFFFDTEEDQMKFYHIFDAILTDSSPIYACTYDNNGVALTENT